MRSPRPRRFGNIARRTVARRALVGCAVTATVAAGILTSSAVGDAGAATAPAPGSGTHTRAQVPWRSVGAGWTIATWAAHPTSRVELLLVSPGGVRYEIRTLPAGSQPDLWSSDGTRALVGTSSGPVEVTLRTGTMHRVRVPGGQLVSYTRPKGLALLEAVDVKHGDYYQSQLERFGLDGTHQLTYPLALPGAGQLNAFGVIETRDGTELVMGARHGLVLLRNNGTLVRRLHPTTTGCEVDSWWSRDVALASCNGVLWTVPISGAKPVRISDGATSENQFGYSDAWRYSTGTAGLAPNGCGPDSVVRFDSSGHGHRVTIPSPTGKAGRPSYVGHHDDVITMIFTADTGCETGARSLFAYDVRYRTEHVLLGPGINGGTVVWAVPYPSTV